MSEVILKKYRGRVLLYKGMPANKYRMHIKIRKPPMYNHQGNN